MNTSLDIPKRRFVTLHLTAQQQTTPTSSLSAFDFTSMTVYAEFASNLGDAPLFVKSSTAADEILITSTTGGELDIYINAEDTQSLQPGPLYWTAYAQNGLSQEFHLITAKINLKENIKFPDE